MYAQIDAIAAVQGNGAGYDADLVVLVKTLPEPPGGCDPAGAASATAFEAATGRPVLGEADLCDIQPSNLAGSLALVLHEIGHILVRTRRQHQAPVDTLR